MASAARRATEVRGPWSELGAYAGPANPAGVRAVSAMIGHRVSYAMDFLDGTSWATISDPSWFLQQWAGVPYHMIWGVPMLPSSGGSLDEGATGAYDQYFVTLAKAFVAGGQGASIIRIGWEFNGGWFPWAAKGQAAAFVAYWRRIVTSMRSVPGAHFRFTWNPTRGDLGVGNLSEYYPGNAYVNIIGLDIYDTEWGSYPGAQREWSYMLSEPYGLDWLASFAGAHHKPMALSEWGLGWSGSGMIGGGDDSYFVEHIAGWIADHDVADAIVWDYGTDPLPASSAPAATKVFRQAFAMPKTTGTAASGVVCRKTPKRRLLCW